MSSSHISSDSPFVLLSDPGPAFSNRFLFLSNGRQWRCTTCATGWLSEQKALEHEDTDAHVRKARELDKLPPLQGRSSSPDAETDAPLPAAFSSPTMPCLHPTSGSGGIPCVEEDFSTEHPITVHGPQLDTDPPEQLYDDYGGSLAPFKDRLPTDDAAGTSSDWWFPETDIPVDEDSAEVMSDSSSEMLNIDSESSDSEADIIEDQNLRESALNDEDWWPWKSEKECLMDLLAAFPRAVFSESEIEVTRWFASKMGVGGLPTARTVKRHRKEILQMAGTHPALVSGSHGNLYCVASIAKIISDEMANPEVQPHLRFYPEESPERHSDAFHGERWRCEVDGNTSAPMARAKDKQDYFVEEPALANIGPEGAIRLVWPSRWFKREGKMHAKAHFLRENADRDGYVVSSLACIDVPLENFFLSFPRLCEVQGHYGLAHVDHVSGIETQTGIKNLSVQLPNPWRVKAAGSRVHSLPIWLYCDDTSGNVSKKWNKHNSFLFILAGLVQFFALHLYNIHFLSTSNIASPLEMLEKIAADIRDYCRDGLKVWDCELNEEVLLVLWVLAFLGDNPMQSEFASHIGMTGKFFCRVCDVCGKAKERPSGTDGEIARITEFMKVGNLRTRDGTWTTLNQQLDLIKKGVPTRVTQSHTDTEIKDKHFVPLFEELSAACTSVRERNRAQGKDPNEGLTDVIEKILGRRRAEDIFNPVFLFKEFNAHTETPVEILHVILLGVVKYFWRDAVARQTSVTKRILRMRLSSIDAMRDLGLPSIRGSTLVNYAGSLTGRDFRVVAQVAPAVLYDLVPKESYEAWLALCRLTPMVFQPVIEGDLDTYLTKLEAAIDDFLSATALWTIQWFNKPKFHILLHLPSGIRRFAPAILTATEGFESYNLVIRMRSVHSNRYAPSLDIAKAMSFMHAARHLVSSGWVKDTKDQKSRQAGQGVLNLRNDETFVKLLGMISEDSRAGGVAGTKKAVWSETETAANGHRLHLSNDESGPSSTTDLEVDVCTSLYLDNGDTANFNSFVLYREANSNYTHLGQIQEILAFPDKTISILIRPWTIGASQLPYRMPGISPQLRLICISSKDIECCIHTFHNCAAQKCQSTSTHIIRQERVETGRFEDEYLHDNRIDDRILNLAQMRSASHVQTFQLPSDYPPRHPQDSDYNLVADAVKRYEQQRAMLPPSASTNTRGRGGKRKVAAARQSVRPGSVPQTPDQRPESSLRAPTTLDASASGQYPEIASFRSRIAPYIPLPVTPSHPPMLPSYMSFPATPSHPPVQPPHLPFPATPSHSPTHLSYMPLPATPYHPPIQLPSLTHSTPVYLTMMQQSGTPTVQSTMYSPFPLPGPSHSFEPPFPPPETSAYWLPETPAHRHHEWVPRSPETPVPSQKRAQR